ncbi:MAG: hypothetical protein Q9220_000821 [cf. Caloplaca sp. 1 TL-2023]
MADQDFDPTQLSSNQQEALGTYTAVTNQEPSAAIPLLERSQWNVQIAIAKFFDGEAPDPVAEAQSSLSPPPPSSQPSHRESLMNGFSRSPRLQNRPNHLDPAPRIVPQPENLHTYRPPSLLALLFTPITFLYRLLSTSLTLFARLFPFLPQLLSGNRATPRRSRSSTSGRKPLSPRDTASRFAREFEESYGAHSLPFFQDGYAQAYDLAKKDLKFLLVILFSPEHDDTASFVTDTLLSPTVTAFLTSPENQRKIILWAGSVEDSEAYQISTALNCSKFPFSALVAPTPSSSSSQMSTILRISGPTSPTSFTSQLQAAISTHSAALERARASRTEQQASRSLREEQNSAYERSLAQDRERARQRREADEARSRAERAERLANEAKERKAQQVLQWKRWRRSRIPPEPSGSGQGVTRVSIRLAGGERVVRKFRAEEGMEELYAFVECYGVEASEEEGEVEKPAGYEHKYRFRLVSPLPRVVYPFSGGGSIGEKIGRSGNLLVEPIDDDEDAEGA